MERIKNFYLKSGALSAWSATVIALILIIVSAISFQTTVQYNGWFGILESLFARSIQGISKLFTNNYGLGIIIFTVLIRVFLLPLMIFQVDSSKKMQTIQPQMQAIRDKYAGRGRDRDVLQAQNEEMNALYAQNGINPFASLLPLLIQMPVLIALYAAIYKTDVLKTGVFLWAKLGEVDHTFILPILAALFTFFSSWMAMQSNPTQSGVTRVMPYIFPVIIFITGTSVPSALTLYWVVGNIFQTVQTYFLQNPFEARAQRKMIVEQEKQEQKNIRKVKQQLRKQHR